MRKVVITAGGTQEPIDKVRSITNKSTGKLGATIANKFLELDENLEIIYIHGKNSKPVDCNYFNKERVRNIEIVTTEDLEKEVTEILTNEQIDIFVHTMAVADYSVERVVNFEELENILMDEFSNILHKNDNSTLFNLFKSKDPEIDFHDFFLTAVVNSTVETNSKMSSSNNKNAIILHKTKKIISLIKKLSPYTFLVGFKLLNAVTENDLFEAGFNLLRENRCNLVFANDLSHIKSGNHDGILIYPEKNTEYLVGKNDIAYMIAKESLRRSSVYHPKSIKIGETPVIPEEVFNDLSCTGNALYASYLLPEVINYDRVNEDGSPNVGTYGNLSVCLDDVIYMTGRNVHKGNLSKEDLALVVGVKEEKITNDLEKIYAKVKYLGHKPSIDAAIHSSIYKETDCKAILHVHTSKVFLGYPMVNDSYPCGSDAERNAILEKIKDNPDKKVVQMYKHGLIIYGENLQECYTKLSEIICEGLYIDYEDHTWDDETHNHFKEVNGSKVLDVNNIYALYHNGQLIGNVYDKRELDKNIPEIQILNFAIITGDSVKGKGLGIVKKYLDLWQDKYEMRLHTMKDCNIKDMYINKYGFTPINNFFDYKDENHIILVKSSYPQIVGISGYSGSGKTTLCSALEDKYDYFKIDCDAISKTIMSKSEVVEEIKKTFGKDIVIFGETATPTKSINRSKLASIVFNSEEERQKLNAIMYPKITEEIKNILAKQKGNKILIDAPLIYEVPEILNLCDSLVLVKSDFETLIDRISKRDNISTELATARLDKQKGLLEYEKIANVIVNNNSEVPIPDMEEYYNKLATETVKNIFKKF